MHIPGGAAARVACPPQRTLLSPYLLAHRCCIRWFGSTAPLAVDAPPSPFAHKDETLVGPREGQRPLVSQ